MMKELTDTVLQQKRKRLIKQLKNMDTAILRGSLIERYKKCGKPNCHCVDGKGHGPNYYLSISMAGMRPIMIYISAEYKPMVEEALKNYREFQQTLEKISDINRELLTRKVSL